MSRRLLFITHADVVIDPAVPVTEWGLNDRGRARHAAFAASEAVAGVSAIHASAERKAQDGAAILGQALGLPVQTMAALHENDRSATGYLPREAFEAMADAFFARPTEAVRGWERAVDAQARICAAVHEIVAADATQGDIAIVAHGAVGALFLSDRMGVAISRAQDQPANGGGNYLACRLPGLALDHGWRDIAPGHDAATG